MLEQTTPTLYNCTLYRFCNHYTIVHCSCYHVSSTEWSNCDNRYNIVDVFDVCLDHECVFVCVSVLDVPEHAFVVTDRLSIRFRVSPMTWRFLLLLAANWHCGPNNLQPAASGCRCLLCYQVVSRVSPAYPCMLCMFCTMAITKRHCTTVTKRDPYRSPFVTAVSTSNLLATSACYTV